MCAEERKVNRGRAAIQHNHAKEMARPRCYHLCDRASQGVVMSFGKKGLAAGQSAQSAIPARRPERRPSPFVQPAVRPAEPVDPEKARIAAQREAFIAGERARGSDLGGVAGHVGASAGDTGDARKLQAAIASEFSQRPTTNRPSAMSLRMFGPIEKRNNFIAYLYWFVLGQGSFHRFYCGQSQTAWMQIGLFLGSLILAFTVSGHLIWGLMLWALWIFADLFLIPGMLRSYKAQNSLDVSTFS